MATCPTCRKRFPAEATRCDDDGEALLPDEAFSGVDPDLSPGQQVGEYKVEKKIGEGGFGTVYRAIHPLIGKAAAIKVLSRQYSANPQVVSRFISEARAVNQIRHRNIIDIFSFGALDDGRQYFVMELLEGMPLDQYIRSRGRLTIQEALPILRAVARALDAAHGAQIAHRDLKPENIFLTFDEDRQAFPKLLDFGIAKLFQDEGRGGPKTRTGTPMGTPYYMSPEQCRGKAVDHRTDIYSFGIMIHQMLTGELPFDGEDVMELLIKQASAAPPAMSSVCPDLPRALDAPVLAMLEKDPNRRPASVGAAFDALAHAGNMAGLAVSVPIVPDPAGFATLPQPMGPTALALPSDRTLTPGAVTTGPADVAPRSRQTTWVALGAATAGFVFAMVAWLALRAPPTPTSASAGEPPHSTEIASDPRTRSESNHAGTEHVAAHVDVAAHAANDAGAPTAEKHEVQLTLEGVPQGAALLVDGLRVGTAPGPLALPKGKELVLEIRADGYLPLEHKFVPENDGPLNLTLKRAHAATPKSTKPQLHKDLENAFQ